MRQAPSLRSELQRARKGAPSRKGAPQPTKTSASELRKRSGAYYTPDAVATMLARWAVRSADDRVLDPRLR